MSEVKCRSHGRVAGVYTVQSGRLRVDCDVCGRYVKWAAHTPENWARAGVQAPGSAQRWTSTGVETEVALRARLAAAVRKLRGDSAFVELIDLLLLVGWERALRVTTEAALRRAAEMGCPAAYVESLRHERETWIMAEVQPCAAVDVEPMQRRLL